MHPLLGGMEWEETCFLPCLSSRVNQAEYVTSYFHRYFPSHLNHEPVLATDKELKSNTCLYQFAHFLEIICGRGAILAWMFLKNVFDYPWDMAFSISKDPRFCCSYLISKLCCLAQTLEIGQIWYCYTVPKCGWKRKLLLFYWCYKCFWPISLIHWPHFTNDCREKCYLKWLHNFWV